MFSGLFLVFLSIGLWLAHGSFSFLSDLFSFMLFTIWKLADNWYVP
jgi:hypothetical protein